MIKPVPTQAPARAQYHLGQIIVVGLLAGFLAGLFGVGGGILIVPGLVLVAGMEQRLAHGTSLAAVVPIAIASLLAYALQDNVDWAATLWLSIGAVGGVVIGTRLLHVLPQRTLALLFAAVLVVSAVRLFFDTDATGRTPLTALDAVILVAIGVASGVLAGLLGVGGGLVMVPAMILLFSIAPVIAKGTSSAVIVPTAVMGTVRNRSRGNTDLRAAVIVGVAGMVTAALGGLVSDRMSADLSNILFASLLMLVAIHLTVQVLRTRTVTTAG